MACLILATDDVAGSHKVAWIRPPRTILAMIDTPHVTSFRPGTYNTTRSGASKHRFTRHVLGVCVMSASISPAASKSAEVPLLIGGKFESSSGDRWGEVFNPSTGRVQARVPLGTVEDVNRAVKVAAEALPAWAETPV